MQLTFQIKYNNYNKLQKNNIFTTNYTFIEHICKILNNNYINYSYFKNLTWFSVSLIEIQNHYTDPKLKRMQQ